MIGADLIRGPVGRVLGLIVWMVVFSLLLGAINGWFLQGVDAGVIDGERFDRVILKDTDDKSADDAWRDVTTVVSTTGTATALVATSAYKIEDSSGACHLQGLADTGVTTATAYTPLGSETSVTDAGIVPGCTWSPAGAIFNAGGLAGLVEVILQACGLAPPIALLFTLGTFGSSFMRNLGSHPILAAVLMAIILLLVATLLNTLVPFLVTAFSAVDGNRFAMFDQGLGNVSVVVKNFYAVVLVSSMMMIAWSTFQYIRGSKDALGSGARM